ncbi:LutC/YkgG family protein [Actinacidiphila acidipaludis]|uniref:LUD domain-containing protein n=1 Tax=Actinacidiphila acidipaludis TaxID=2873382 RepID=A0ABS7QDE5_9ACTN|nr:LUD domain-containing protein [Streptomyces acidipaludis]MBY8880846.1 LUD domain-containing protein [Streptomyces acidipaludis]
MTTSRDTILTRIRHALAHDAPGDRTSTADRDYERAVDRAYLTIHADLTPQQAADLLARNLADYRAHVHHTDETGLPHLVDRLLTQHGTRTVLTPDGLPEPWLTAIDATRVPDRPHATHHDLDSIDSVITTCTLAIAETGTIVLTTGSGQGHRRSTLIPDHHICVITPDQIVISVPQALTRLDPTHPQTWISGPSATSDIELDRVEGVHGPRTLDVILVTTTPAP